MSDARPDYRPVADYGLLADCNSSALVDRGGSIDWLCLPRYDSAAVFSRILDPAAGHWSICPSGAFTTERRYLPGTLVIETTFTTDTGACACSTPWPSPRASAATTSATTRRTSCCARSRASRERSSW